MAGIAVGWVFLCLSLTPSLLPRPSHLQGALSGVTAAVGYGIGIGGHALWHYLELPRPGGSARRNVVWGFVALMVGVTAYCAFNLVRWQNDVRRLFGMEHLDEPAYLVVVAVVAGLVAVVAVGVARLLRRAVTAMGHLGGRVVPRRVGRVAGYAAALFLVVTLTTGVLVDGLVGMANQAFGVQNGILDPAVENPGSRFRSGGPGSLIEWETLGRPGRSWVAGGPTAADIDEFSGGGAMEPIRAYVGLDSADGVDERADLLVDELVRMGAFERSVLVVATSTGSGGLDPRGTQVVEYLHNGDTAIAGVQYSFLPSWISYFVDQSAAKDAATATFEAVHDHWRTLDPDRRPALYLFGVSLGSFGSESAARSLRTSGDPIDGAVWAGPTFNNEEWLAVTRNRDAGSPAWLPIYDDGTVVRFTNRTNALDEPQGEWSSRRFVYILHGSDPVSFFSTDLLLHEPDWLEGDRSPEVNRHMRWYPVVTFWQVAFDLAVGGSVPPGYGHNFAVPAYVDAWIGVSQPEGWTEADSARLVEHLTPPEG